MLASRSAVLVGAVLLSLACTESKEAARASSGGAGGSSAVGGSGGSAASGGGGQTSSGGSATTGGIGGAAGALAGSGGQSAGQGGTSGTAGVGGSATGGVAGQASGGAGAGGATGGVAGQASGGAGAGGATGGAAGAAGSSGSSGGPGTPGVRIVGRAAASGMNQRFGWPGVQIRARFSGTQASIQLNDAGYQNAFEIVIDGGTPRKFRTMNGQSSYSLATGLAPGDHEVLVWRSTEVFDSGVTEFAGINGFSSGGALLAPPAAPDRRIEVIGDSISVGAGLEGGASGCAADKNSTDNYFAYGSIAARTVGADIVTVAYSGIGVYRSYSANDPTMPARYDRTLPADTTATWDFAKYQPHVIVINLGTNDFGAGDPGQSYVTTYVSFVQHVRSKVANAHFILIAMYGNQETAVGQVVTAIKNGGDQKIEQLNFNSVQNNLGCAQHPNAAAHQAMGASLTTRIRAATGW